jgi:hypothetical protein
MPKNALEGRFFISNAAFAPEIGPFVRFEAVDLAISGMKTHEKCTTNIKFYSVKNFWRKAFPPCTGKKH